MKTVLFLYMRKPRHIVLKATYHVCARANRQELILEDEQMKLLFLEVLKRAKNKYAFIFRNFCIMGNHIHLEITPQGESSISQIKSKVIETLQQLINTFLYIANNPVRAGLTNHPLEFIYSGISFHKNGPPWPAYKNLLDPITNNTLQDAIDYHLSEYNCEKYSKQDETCSFRSKR